MIHFVQRLTTSSIIITNTTKSTVLYRLMSTAPVIRNSSKKFQLALCQISVGNNKEVNIVTAKNAIGKAVEQTKAQIVSLPECWNSPYATSSFPIYAEEIPSKKSQLTQKDHPSTFALSESAKEHGIYLIGGSIPERFGDKVYNTCVIFTPEGEILVKHRKVHLFDIDVPGKITFKESDTLTGGDQVTVFDTPFCKIGVGICYDIRFPLLSMLMRQRGAQVLIFPGAFNLTTGPAHWELLQRGRAVDNQLYVAAVSPSRSKDEKGYQAWGHSTIVSPWGEVVATCEHGDAIVSAEIDLEKVDEMRRNIPTSTQIRNDLYELVDKH
jgi:omega-amidase